MGFIASNEMFKNVKYEQMTDAYAYAYDAFLKTLISKGQKKFETYLKCDFLSKKMCFFHQKFKELFFSLNFGHQFQSCIDRTDFKFQQ